MAGGTATPTLRDSIWTGQSHFSRQAWTGGHWLILRIILDTIFCEAPPADDAGGTADVGGWRVWGGDCPACCGTAPLTE